MPRYKTRNHELHARWKRRVSDGRKALAAAPTDDRRFLVYEAVRLQCEHDHKAPWSIDQKLNDAPYRYTRDTLWAALNGIKDRLAASNPAVTFGTEDDFKSPSYATFSEFVNGQLTKTVSSLISAIMDASRWAA